MLAKHAFIVLIFASVTTGFIFSSGCRQVNKNGSTNQPPEIEHGKILAKKYCSGCHQYPDPGLLDKATWQRGIMPAMGKLLGIDDFKGTFSAKNNAAISVADFEAIVNFYSTLAPDSLKTNLHADHPFHDMAIFKLDTVPAGGISTPPLTTALAYDPYTGELYSADAANNFFRWDIQLHAHLISKLPSPATGILFTKGPGNITRVIVTCIGSLMPANVSSGKVLQYDLHQSSIANKVVLADNLPRTVKVVPGDFNRDGLTDYAVLCFGHDNGGLYWLKQLPSHLYRKELIRGVPGAIDAAVTDIDHDGWPDIVCLFAQADEGIWSFINDHKDGFVTKNLHRFPPVYGSNSMQLVDMNHDGKDDIVYTAGDNADYSPILKPYHGVYIFINQGNFSFKQEYFYPMNGCGKAIAADFDHDGDIDLATISFFPDTKGHPTESAVYLEQTGPLKFKPHELPVNKLGHWLVMDINNLNADKYPGLVLGNFTFDRGGKPGLKPATAAAPLILLENRLHKELNK